MSNRDVIHDRVWDAYHGVLGENWKRDTQKRIHWICEAALGNKILDVGCSSGIVPILLGREGRNVVGIDNDPKCIAEATAHLDEEPLSVQKNVSFIESNFLNCGHLKGQKFDTVIMSELLEHLVKPADFLEAASLYMRVGSSLIVTVPFGINDFIDHKRTYYLTEIHGLLEQFVKISHVEILGKWIGLIGQKTGGKATNRIKKSWNTDEVKALEDAFYMIERKLQDELTEARSKNSILKENDRTLKAEVKVQVSEISKLENLKNKLSSELEASKKELVKQKTAVQERTEQLDSARKDNISASKKIEQLHRQIRFTEDELNQALKRISILEDSISFRLGKTIIESRQSWRGFVTLPLRILRLRREGAARLKKKGSYDHSGTVNLAEDPDSGRTIDPPDESSIEEARTAFKARSSQKLKELRVASVMDEFTYHSFEPECKLLQLHPESWHADITAFNPELVFIESAWKGLDGLWRTKISNPISEILDIVEWCRSKRIPTVFWNKEDPVHFGTFLPIAKIVDFIFTTDMDCIPKYKRYLQHDRVYLLPFAAQPKMHNPVEIEERKDAFCFAGSYYLRYPVRQRDFSTLIETVEKFRNVEIYDRNFDNPHPHYTFPDKYKPLILGRLPFSEIDRAYKGYRYGINVNTIKESQTMFARRVFELMASNTVVVSNFSRAMRLLFGDLVISSDDGKEIQNRLRLICNDETAYRKFRLMGLRKVIARHTYAHRLGYMEAKVSGREFHPSQPSVAVLAVVSSADERERVLCHFQRQAYSEKRLFLLEKDNLSGTKIPIGAQFSDIESCKETLLEEFARIPFAALFVAHDYYGPEYLTDLVLASTYSNASGFGKSSHYVADNDECNLRNDGDQYRPVESLFARCSIVRTQGLPADWIYECLTNPEEVTLPSTNNLSTDEFHYCRSAEILDESVLQDTLEDIHLIARGIDINKTLLDITENLRPETHIAHAETTVPHLSAKRLFKLFNPAKTNAIKFEIGNGVIKTISTLDSDQHTYVYARKRFGRDELNFVTNSNFKLDCNSEFELHTVFEFYDSDGRKLSHAINRAGEANALAIPEQCETVRFGIRIKGSGRANIRRLTLGGNAERPSLIVGQSQHLVVAKQYPSYDDLYRYGFLHSRIRAYKEHGLHVDVFRMTSDDGQYFREFEGIDVASGDVSILDATLRTGQYKHVLVHLIDEVMWGVLQKYIDNMKVTVWVHGAEIQVWQRRSFEFEHLQSDEIKRQKGLSQQRVRFWRDLINGNYQNLHLVFVSNWLLESAFTDLDLECPTEKVSVIHNFIDPQLFSYHEKQADDRLKILTVRPFNKLVYGNDLAISAIVELSRRDYFNELEFTIVGDGELFEETVSAVEQFRNVRIERKFLTQSDLSRYHKQHGVFLIPTRMDTQGVSRDEAMASGLVPVTTDVGGVSEFVDESCGIVVTPENPMALADAIESLYRDTELFLKLSAAAARRVRSQSGLDQTIRREIALIEH